MAKSALAVLITAFVESPTAALEFVSPSAQLLLVDAGGSIKIIVEFCFFLVFFFIRFTWNRERYYEIAVVRDELFLCGWFVVLYCLLKASLCFLLLFDTSTHRSAARF